MPTIVMNYEMDALAAVIQLPESSTRGISTITGMSERKVRIVLDTLINEYGVIFEKKRVNRTICYRISSWGIFDPSATIKRLGDVDLIQVKASRIRKRKNLTLTQQDKAKAYTNSLRLEGLEPVTLPVQKMNESRSEYKERVIAQFRRSKNG